MVSRDLRVSSIARVGEWGIRRHIKHVRGRNLLFSWLLLPICIHFMTINLLDDLLLVYLREAVTADSRIENGR